MLKETNRNSFSLSLFKEIQDKQTEPLNNFVSRLAWQNKVK